MFKYSFDNKRYHTLNYYFKNKYQAKVCKVPINAGFTCPNRTNKGGCIFCSPSGSGEFAGLPSTNLLKQFEDGKKMMQKKWPNAKFIAYFQANTNTYAPVNILKEKIEPFLNIKDIIGIDLATRPDCLSPECLSYLADLNQRTNLTIELGLQSIHEKTLQYINRGHNLATFDQAVLTLNKLHIPVIIHIINGLPGEDKNMMLETIKHLNTLPINGLKIHMLYIVKDTPLASTYLHDPFPLLTKEEYIDIIINELELLRPEIVIHRLTGDPKKEDLIAPTWLLKKVSILDDIDKEMLKKNTYQGKKFNIN